jgi:hypothetical protein
MPGLSLADTISQLSVGDEWGPETTTSTTLDGVPYAPFSKGDKLGRMADWTQEGKEGRDRGGRQYGRNFRGESREQLIKNRINISQISKSTVRAHRPSSLSRSPKTSPRSRSSTTLAHPLRLVPLVVAVNSHSAAEAREALPSEAAREAASSALVKAVHNSKTNIMTTGVDVVDVVAAALVGVITTSPSATVTLRSTFARTGLCGRKLTSVASPS